MTAPAFVRCKDNTLVRDLLDVGRVYECTGEEDHNYRVRGKWLTKGRFTAATYAEWIESRNA